MKSSRFLIPFFPLLLASACFKPMVRMAPPGKAESPDTSVVLAPALAQDTPLDTLLPDTLFVTAPDSDTAVVAPPLPETAPVPAALPAHPVPRNTARVFLLPARKFLSFDLSAPFAVTAEGKSSGVIQGKQTIRVDRAAVFFPSGPGTVAMPVTLVPVSRGSLFHLNGRAYRGRLIIQATSRGAPILVNEVPIEEYLRGVVPYEIGKRDSSAIEALKVQAVVARTYTYGRLGSRDADGFDLYPDESDQVYNGVKGEYALSDAAVLATRDQVVTYNDSLIQAFYFSTSSGRTASIEEVWPDRGFRPYLRSVDDSIFNQYSPHFRWKEEWTKKELERILNASLRPLCAGFKPGALQNVWVEALNSCGRVKTLAIRIGGNTWRVSGDRTRWALRRSQKGSPILKSSWFRLDVNRNGKGEVTKVTAQGRGFGHGVGLSQIGALGMAAAGKNYEEIIRAYYTGVRIAVAKY